MILLATSLVLLGVIARGLDRLAEVPGESRATKLARILLGSIATIVVVEALLGAIGLLDPRATVAALGALAGILLVRMRRHPRLPPAIREPLSAADVMLVGGLVAVIAIGLWTASHRTTFLYDTLSYHLHVPATWMHDRRISIVPAVFGDPSSAYAPSNFELVFVFLMAPLRSDLLAGAGQLPFAALAAAAIVATVRESGGPRTAALAAALAFLLIPEVWGQVATAMTDLGLAACLLASLPFGLRLWRAQMPSRADLHLFAVAVGLGVGSKYAGAALAVPFLAAGVAAIVRRRRRVRWRDGALALGALIATGGFWYVRNLAVAGNPTYPVALAGLPLPALYGGAQMRAWEYHLPVGDLRALGSMLLAAGIGFGSAAAIALARLWRGVEVPLVAALLAIFWLVIPYQESRFLFAAFGVGAIALARSASRPPAWLGAGGIGVAIAGSLLESPTPARLLLLPATAAAGIAFLIWRRLPTRAGSLVARAAFVAGAIAVAFGLAAGHRQSSQRDPGYTVDDEGLAAAWSWFRANVHDVRVAYTGTNLAFPLSGERLANRVRYVNVAGAPGARLHDFGPPGDGTAEPAPYRRGASADVWLANLRAERAQVLFIAALYPIVRRTIDADTDGFPVERAWADARPGIFRLRYGSPAARVYAVDLP